MKKSRLFFLVPYVLWLGLFVIAPIILITINAVSYTHLSSQFASSVEEK